VRHEPADARAALDDVYRTRSNSLVRQLTRHTGCSETARELAQEAFLRFLRLPSNRVSQIDQPEAYLRRICTNLLRDWGRNRALRQSSDTPQFATEMHVDQVAVLESRDTLRRLELAISKLKPKTRAIFLAHRLDGLSYYEIAEQTGLSVKGVEKQMSKAIAKIDRLLDRP
jgi:RNA polymerase sigma-70 factor (ECF subfamily)